MRFTHILFDLDDTLYSPDVGLMQEMGRRITRWVQHGLGLSPQEAAELRRRYLEQYGTTLGGLVAEHDVAVDAYLAFVHDVPVEQYVLPSPALGRMLAAIPLRKAVFTNATSEHALRVLRALDVTDQFERVVGIRELGMCHKPRPDAYRRLLALLGAEGPACFLVEDRPANLVPGKQLGMTTVLVGGVSCSGVDHVVADILEVGPLVEGLLGAHGG